MDRPGKGPSRLESGGSPVKATPVVMLGWDAVEGTLVRRLLEEDRLPNLGALRRAGMWGDLRTAPTGFLSMVWPTFFEGRSAGDHGWYFNKLWRAERMRLEYASPDWLPLRPFWMDLDRGIRAAIVDVPFGAVVPSDLDGIFLNGWQCHDDFGSREHPRGILKELGRKVGKPVLGPEIFGPQSVRTLLRQREAALESIAQFGDLCVELLRGERWDLFVSVFGGAHRGSHYLWNLSQVDEKGASADELALLEDATSELYEALDRSLGRILDVLPGDARVMVFALHGMGPNQGWAEYFARMVDLVRRDGAEERDDQGLIFRVKKALPWQLVRQVTMRLPSALNQALVPLWSRRMYDWGETRYFALPLDLNGYLRFSVQGRERDGLVERGSEYDRLVEHLREALTSFRDLRTGEPVVDRVEDVDELVGPDAPRRDVLPDLIAHWADCSAIDSPGMRSPRYGEIRWDRPTRLPSGRSGNHTDRGWFVASGPGIPAGATSREDADTVNLAPTVFEWMGLPRLERFTAGPVEALCRPDPADAPGHPGEEPGRVDPRRRT